MSILFYYSGINSGTKQVHGACCVEVTSRQVFVSEAEVRAIEGERVFECTQYHGGGDFFPLSGGGVDTSGWGCWSGALFLEVEYAAAE